ncbi:MAG: aconitase family protein [Pseudolabrys sp.]
MDQDVADARLPRRQQYLESTGLQTYLDTLGFNVAGYSCGTCVGASGPIDAKLEKQILDNDVVACAVLSGNRKFRIAHSSGGTRGIPGEPAFGRRFCARRHRPISTCTPSRSASAATAEKRLSARSMPSPQEIDATLTAAAHPEFYAEAYGGDITAVQSTVADYPAGVRRALPVGQHVELHQGAAIPRCRFAKDRAEGYFRRARFGHPRQFGDHRSHQPDRQHQGHVAGGLYLRELGVAQLDFNNYGARRMNHEVMMRGAFANLQLKNFMVPGVEGGVTLHQPDAAQMSIYEAAMRYRAEKVPLIVIAGEEYGTGSARDWAAKAPRLLGVRAVVASSFERIQPAAILSAWACCRASLRRARMPRPIIWTARNVRSRRPGRNHQAWRRRHAGRAPRERHRRRNTADAAARYPDGSRLRAAGRHHALRSRRTDQGYARARRVSALRR